MTPITVGEGVTAVRGDPCDDCIWVRTIGFKTILSFLVLATGAWAPAVTAQAADTLNGPPPVPFFNRTDAFLAAGFVAGTFGLAFADQHLAHAFQDPSLQESVTARRTADFFEFMGHPAPEIIGVALYGVSRFIVRDRHVAALGLHGLEALLVSVGATGILKAATGRARPYVQADTGPSGFSFGRGLMDREYRSFPSGHTSAAFAVAASATVEMSRLVDEKDWWPGWKYVIGGAMFGGATMVGISRMYHEQHWASDVVAGAAIGTFSGIKTVSYAHRNPANRIDGWLLPMTALPGLDGGVILAWAVPEPFGVAARTAHK
jgi:membrane-associated phospholipid phosphatase